MSEEKKIEDDLPTQPGDRLRRILASNPDELPLEPIPPAETPPAGPPPPFSVSIEDPAPETQVLPPDQKRRW